MDLATLALFRTVAEEQSITRAAERLERAPSNVTTRIQQLEAEIGAQLFQRDTKRMRLTSAGETFLDYAGRILHLADEAQQVINPTVPGGVLRIGSMECCLASRLPTPLARYNRAWPQVTLNLTTAPSRQLVDQLLAQRIDCALVAVPQGEFWLEPGTLELLPVFREDLVLLLPPDHRPVASSADIGPQALAAFAMGCTYRMLLEDWLNDKAGAARRFAVHEVRSYHAMFACTAAGACISVMPRSVLDLMRAIAPITEVPLMRVDTYLASRPGFATPAFHAFRDLLVAFSNIAADDHARAWSSGSDAFP